MKPCHVNDLFLSLAGNLKLRHSCPQSTSGLVRGKGPEKDRLTFFKNGINDDQRRKRSPVSGQTNE